MFIKCYVENTVELGDIVEYDPVNGNWRHLTSSESHPWGVIVTNPVQDEDNQEKYLSKIQFSGVCLAKASRDIPDSGGHLSVEPGGVYVSESSSCGLVSPNSYNGEDRLSSNLILVNIK